MAGLVVLLVPAALALNPQVELRQYSVRAWRKQDGLPASRVLDVVQTRDGYLWVGTSNGLARFDGKRFLNYDLQTLTDCASNGIRRLHEDRRGRLWISTSGGIAVLEAGVFRGLNSFKRDLISFKNVEIDGLTEDREGAIWIATANGLYRWQEGAVRTYRVEDGLPTNTVFSGALAGDGSVWFGSDLGAVRFRNGVFTTFTTANGLADNIVSSVNADRSGAIWVATTRGLSRFQEQSFFTYFAKTFPPAVTVKALVEDRDSNIWLGGTNSFGPVRMRSGKFDAFPPGSAASDPIVYAYAEDREGTLWLGTSDGLQQIRDRPFDSLTTSDGLPANNIRVVYPARDGTIWMGGNRFGLASLKGRQVETFDQSSGLSALGVSAILERQNGALLAATTYHGLNLLRGRHWEPYLKEALPTERITGLLEDANQELWIGTEDKGAIHLREGRVEVISKQQGLGSNFITKLMNGPNGEVWIGTEHGLRVWNKGALRSLGPRGEFDTINITGLLAARNGDLWIATAKALFRFANGRVMRFGVEQGIPDGTVGQPVEDDLGKLWFFTNSGLARFTPPAKNSGEAPPGALELFSAPDGLASDAHGGPPQHIAKAPDGRIWLATTRGLSVVDPAQLRKNPLPPPVRIEEVVADQEARQPGLPVTLSAGNQRVEIRYTGLSLAIPERVRFRYRLEPFDADWRDAGTERTATYTNLPAAEYRFRVLAANQDGVWNTTGAELRIVQLPHWYQTWWFRIASIAFVCLAVWSLYQLRLRQIGKEFALVLEERTRIARELHDTLLQGFTAATLQVQAATDKIEIPPPERQALEAAMLHADEQLREARRAVWDLRPSALESRDLVSALRKVAGTENGGRPLRQLIVEGKPVPLTPRIESAVLRVAEEAIANATRHSGADQISIRLAFLPDCLRLTVRDNGRGFICEIAATADGHFGLRGMRERVEAAGGRFSLVSVPGESTEVLAEFPLRPPSRRSMRNFI